MISDRSGLHSVLLQLITEYQATSGSFFKIKTEEIPFFASNENKPFKRTRVMARTVLSNCPIEAEIRAVDSQSDLRILL